MKKLSLTRSSKLSSTARADAIVQLVEISKTWMHKLESLGVDCKLLVITNVKNEIFSLLECEPKAREKCAKLVRAFRKPIGEQQRQPV